MSSNLVDLRRPEERELLRSGPGDRYFDYCLQPYQPRRPTEGKLRAENILWKSLEVAGCIDDYREPFAAMQQGLGRDMTVWGVKHAEGRLWWELYLYDPRKEDPAATVEGVSAILSPWVRVAPSPRESIPYMMFSFDLSPGTLEAGQVDRLNLYLTGTEEHAGRSYIVTEQGAELDNEYVFMEPKRDIDRVLPLLKSSVFVDYSEEPVLAQVLMPKLFACKRVCVAKKRFSDAIYFSGIDIDQLLWFLRSFDYPEPLVSFVAAHREGFEHLYFDVGIDYRQQDDGSIVYPKTSFYGTL